MWRQWVFSKEICQNGHMLDVQYLMIWKSLCSRGVIKQNKLSFTFIWPSHQVTWFQYLYQFMSTPSIMCCLFPNHVIPISAPCDAHPCIMWWQFLCHLMLNSVPCASHRCTMWFSSLYYVTPLSTPHDADLCTMWCSPVSHVMPTFKPCDVHR